MDNLMWALIFYIAHGSGTINEIGLFGFWYGRNIRHKHIAHILYAQMLS